MDPRLEAPSSCEAPGQGLRAGGVGVSQAQPASPFFTLASGATSVGLLNVGSHISFGEGMLGGGSWSQEMRSKW